MYTIHLKITTKITKQSYIANKPTKEIKLNHKNTQEGRQKKEMENKEQTRQAESK